MAIVYFAENINRVAGEDCTLTLTLTFTLTLTLTLTRTRTLSVTLIRRQLGDSPQPLP